MDAARPRSFETDEPSAADRPLVLVVDDEEVIRETCRQILEGCGYRVETCKDGLEALSRIRLRPVDLILLDLKMPRLDGIGFLRRLRAEAPGIDVIVITGYSSVGSAVECMRLGAYDYLPKPFNAGTLRIVVERAMEKRRLAVENAALRQRLGEPALMSGVLHGCSESVRRIRNTVWKVAPADSTVMILGESGTGKELVARAIHRASPRASCPFVPVDCNALAESLWASELFGHVRGAFTGAVSDRCGRFEEADGGTLFLDEIGNMDPSLQAKLLRVLQEREITRVGANDPVQLDVRIISATNQDLHAAMRRGDFREDLFYRLSVVTIEIPPLRERRQDIPVLAQTLLSRMSERRGLSPKRLSPCAIEALERYEWPGNAREVENTLERALLVATGEEVRVEDLQFAPPPAQSPALPSARKGPVGSAAPVESGSGGVPADDLSLSSVEREHVRRVLELTSWHLARTAKLLGIDRKTLWRKIRQYGLKGDRP
jgi:DNA-binding NtrC family response regulator